MDGLGRGQHKSLFSYKKRGTGVVGWEGGVIRRIETELRGGGKVERAGIGGEGQSITEK